MHSSLFIQFDEINAYIEKISASNTFEDLVSVFQEQIEILGFNYFTYCVIWPMSGPRKPLYISSFREDYSKHYIEQDFKNIDPVWQQVSKQTTPFSWTEILSKQLSEDTSKRKIVFNASRDFDMRSGGTIPLYGPGRFKGGVTIACSDEQTVFDMQFTKYIGYLQIIASYLHERMMAMIIEFDNNPSHEPSLTQREKEILLWAAQGKTNWEIGEILGISENTVRNHFVHICSKSAVTNKTQAVAHAIMNGDILL